MKRLVLVIACYLGLQFGLEMIASEELVYNSLIDQMSEERISEMIYQITKWRWLAYLLFAIFVCIKIFFVSLCFSIGDLINNEKKVEFKDFFTVATRAEFVFLLPMCLKLVWFSIIESNYTLQNVQFFHPLSVLSLFDLSELETWWLYPLQILNVFELLYWAVLAYLLKPILGTGFGTSVKFVAVTYGVGLLFWVVLVMFLTISLS